ncbi:MAG: 16S rRNA (cytosine(1402)-N(4))-methyltransferase RsmH [Actinomycetota bacterium]|nr:16S rRNA (cytosine(1402)-N(4))-methyltransferase RsmH [Actinomycetota bacterium]
MGHFPVMLEEAVAALRPMEGDTFVDATFGGGGHSRRLLEEIGVGGRLVGIDRDPEAAERVGDLASGQRFEFKRGTYDDALHRMVEDGESVDGILFDLGLSSFQIDEADRGFSYVNEGPLDMRMDPSGGESAAEFLNSADEGEISAVLSEFGDVSRGEARRVAGEVLRRRPLSTTLDLSEAVRDALGWTKRRGNPSRRVFQAVRMYLNDELGGLMRALDAVERLLKPGGRLVAITFHSGEDRLVKRFIADRVGRCVCPPEVPVCVCGEAPIFRKGKVLTPTAVELESNPRSGSARLRSAVRTEEPLTDDLRDS